MKTNPDWEVAEKERVVLEEAYKSVLATHKTDTELAQKAIQAAKDIRKEADREFQVALLAHNQKVNDSISANEAANEMQKIADQKLHDFNVKLEAANEKVRSTPQFEN